MPLSGALVSELDHLRSAQAHFWGFVLTSSHVSWTGYGSCGKPVLTTSASSGKSVRSLKTLKNESLFLMPFHVTVKKGMTKPAASEKRGGFKSCGFVFGLAACTHIRGINFQFSSIISFH